VIYVGDVLLLRFDKKYSYNFRGWPLRRTRKWEVTVKVQLRETGSGNGWRVEFLGSC